MSGVTGECEHGSTFPHVDEDFVTGSRIECPGPAAVIGGQLSAGDFSRLFKARMIAAYPVIAQMTTEQAYGATVAEWDAAFERILANRNLRRTCELEYAKRGRS